jgi:hypothetical protein
MSKKNEGKRRSEARKLRFQRKSARHKEAYARRWLHLHPELAPATVSINWNRLSRARQARTRQVDA